MGPIITIETSTKIDRRFPSYCVTRYEVLEDGEVVKSFICPERAEKWARSYERTLRYQAVTAELRAVNEKFDDIGRDLAKFNRLLRINGKAE